MVSPLSSFSVISRANASILAESIVVSGGGARPCGETSNARLPDHTSDCLVSFALGAARRTQHGVIGTRARIGWPSHSDRTISCRRYNDGQFSVEPIPVKQTATAFFPAPRLPPAPRIDCPPTKTSKPRVLFDQATYELKARRRRATTQHAGWCALALHLLQATTGGNSRWKVRSLKLGSHETCGPISPPPR